MRWFYWLSFIKRLLQDGFHVIGIDNLNDYYEVTLKNARLNLLKDYDRFHFYKARFRKKPQVSETFARYQPSVVVNLGAQAGVRYSLENPQEYVDSNITGFLTLLEECKRTKVANLIYASSSSVYGLNGDLPFAAKHPVDHPISIYASTKRTNEFFAHIYSHLYGLPTTGIRFLQFLDRGEDLICPCFHLQNRF